jgi:hypothetical protein
MDAWMLGRQPARVQRWHHAGFRRSGHAAARGAPPKIGAYLARAFVHLAASVNILVVCATHQ